MSGHVADALRLYMIGIEPLWYHGPSWYAFIRVGYVHIRLGLSRESVTGTCLLTPSSGVFHAPPALCVAQTAHTLVLTPADHASTPGSTTQRQHQCGHGPCIMGAWGASKLGGGWQPAVMHGVACHAHRGAGARCRRPNHIHRHFHPWRPTLRRRRRRRRRLLLLRLCRRRLEALLLDLQHRVHRLQLGVVDDGLQVRARVPRGAIRHLLEPHT
eukprot:COSAG01_NODE_5157_length_4446_cov_1.899471_3_plen_214_part_00